MESLEKITVKTHEDDKWEYGYYVYKGDSVKTSWCKLKNWNNYFWFVNHPQYTLQLIGIKIDKKKSEFLQFFFEDKWIDGIYYLWGITQDLNDLQKEKAINLILGPLTELEHYTDITIQEIRTMLILNFDFAEIKDIIKRKVDGENIYDVICEFSLKEKFDIQSIIHKMQEEIKEKLNEKTINWFVGQVMKKSQGKAKANEVKKYFEDILNVDNNIS